MKPTTGPAPGAGAAEHLSGALTPRFDELIHAPTRLSIVSLLTATEWAEFKFLRDQAGLTDSALSKQLTTLEDAGYVDIRKSFIGKRPRTSVRLSPAGAASLRRPRRRSAGHRGPLGPGRAARVSAPLTPSP